MFLVSVSRHKVATRKRKLIKRMFATWVWKDNKIYTHHLYQVVQPKYEKRGSQDNYTKTILVPSWLQFSYLESQSIRFCAINS